MIRGGCRSPEPSTSVTWPTPLRNWLNNWVESVTPLAWALATFSSGVLKTEKPWA